MSNWIVVNSSGFHHSDPRAQAAHPDAGVATPSLDYWHSQMTTQGAAWGEYLITFDPFTQAGNDFYSETDGVYYDAQRIYFQIADYTTQSAPWNNYAQEAERIYLAYLENRSPPFNTQGYRRFAAGISMDAIRTGDSTAVANVPKMRDEGAYANVLTSGFTDLWYYYNRSREIAYLISAHVSAEKAGHARLELSLALYLCMAMAHLNEWIQGFTANPDQDPALQRIAPFMIGLTCEALIEYYEWEMANNRIPDVIFSRDDLVNYPTRTIETGIAQVVYALRYTLTVQTGAEAGQSLWVADIGGTPGGWNTSGGTGYAGFRYEDTDRGATDPSTNPAPDLSLLIAPVYAWVYKQTGAVDYINIADELFVGGLALSNLARNTKVFNQNYRWSFDYVKWRNEGLQNAGLI